MFTVHTPVWCTVVRGFQAFFGFIIIILAGLIIHGLALDAVIFALVCVSPRLLLARATCDPRGLTECGLRASSL